MNNSTINSIIILNRALDEVFEENQSFCLDNETERNMLRGLVVGTFTKLIIEGQEKTDETTIS